MLIIQVLERQRQEFPDQPDSQTGELQTTVRLRLKSKVDLWQVHTLLYAYMHLHTYTHRHTLLSLRNIYEIY